MNATQHEQWLADTRRFWDAGSSFEAKYRRICSDPEIDATDDEQTLRALWAKRTDDELAYLLDDISIQPEWTCLEIGCGLGRLMKPISARCRKIIGVDISPKMVAYSKSYLCDNPNVEIHLNDGTDLAMVDTSSVDLVYSVLVFQHLTTEEVVDSYLSEISRVLKRGGCCRIQCWREAPLSMRQRTTNLLRRVVGVEPYHGPRRWCWAPGKEVRFGGLTHHPQQWRRRLRRFGLRVTRLQTGLGHDFWMWTTSRKR